jgi:hypothetical protein
MKANISNTIEGVNTFLVEQSKSTEGICRVKIVQFDHLYEIVSEFDVNDSNWILTSEVHYARGNTALFDAIGRTIADNGVMFASMTESERPSSVSVIVYTDGEENASTEYTAEVVADMVKHQTDMYGWAFSFFGASKDVALAGKRLNIGSTYVYNPADYRSVQATYTAANNSVLRGRAGGQTNVIASDFTVDADLVANV